MFVIHASTNESGGLMTGSTVVSIDNCSSEVMTRSSVVSTGSSEAIIFGLENSKTDLGCQFGRSCIWPQLCLQLETPYYVRLLGVRITETQSCFILFFFTYFAFKGRLSISFCTEFSPCMPQPSKRRGWSLFDFAGPLCTGLDGISDLIVIFSPYGYRKHEICCFRNARFEGSYAGNIVLQL